MKGNMPIRAKFKVRSNDLPRDTTNPDATAVIHLDVVHGGSNENKKFFKFTPSGTIELGVVSQETAVQFAVGEQFYVDFTPVNPPVEKPQIKKTPARATAPPRPQKSQTLSQTARVGKRGASKSAKNEVSTKPAAKPASKSSHHFH